MWLKVTQKRSTFLLFLFAYLYSIQKLAFLQNIVYYRPSMKTEKIEEFAIIQTGGKQYKVSLGSVVSIEKLKSTKVEYKKGDTVSFDKVLLVDDGKNTTIGAPYISGAKVDAEIMEIGRAKKVMVLRYKQKSRYLKINGHRQPFFKVKITSIK